MRSACARPPMEPASVTSTLITLNPQALNSEPRCSLDLRWNKLSAPKHSGGRGISADARVTLILTPAQPSTSPESNPHPHPSLSPITLTHTLALTLPSTEITRSARARCAAGSALKITRWAGSSSRSTSKAGRSLGSERCAKAPSREESSPVVKSSSQEATDGKIGRQARAPSRTRPTRRATFSSVQGAHGPVPVKAHLRASTCAGRARCCARRCSTRVKTQGTYWLTCGACWRPCTSTGYPFISPIPYSPNPHPRPAHRPSPSPRYVCVCTSTGYLLPGLSAYLVKDLGLARSCGAQAWRTFDDV